MKSEAARKRTLLSAVLGAALTALCGLILSKAPVGEPWVHASYDYLFRFGSHAITNNVVLIQMDNEAYAYFAQTRERPWDRKIHATLLRKLKEDGCALVVMDSFFRGAGDPATDELLAAAMRQQRVVLMAEQAAVTHPDLAGSYPILPAEPFASATGTNWGVAWLDPDLDSVVRRHWPFPSPGPYPSLPWAAARGSGSRLNEATLGRWLRYYKPKSAWTTIGYRLAMAQPTNYFHDKVVFIGNQPKTSIPGDEPDEFRTPFTRWTGEAIGGVQIVITSFLNLINGDWLQRPAWWLETLLFLATGSVLGWVLCHVRPFTACVLAASFASVVFLGAVSSSHFTKYWFPWLVIAGGQVPCGLLWALGTHRMRAPETALGLAGGAKPPQQAPGAHPLPAPVQELPEIPGYELLSPPIGKGSYGTVWIARKGGGPWQALKVIYRESFGDNPEPYEREFNGVMRYQPISDKHPGLLRVDVVSPMKPEGYFFYVMELGDPMEAGWEHSPCNYQPRDLSREQRGRADRKLPSPECVRIGLALTDALDFLHQRGLAHRDIKPQNVIFVNGRPKLADMGLIAEIRPPDQPATYVGTPGYMPPPPEALGTPQADVYALGMMLYVLSTGRSPTLFPELSTTLVERNTFSDFLPLNSVILKACHPDPPQRYASAGEMRRALLEVDSALEGASPGAVFDAAR